MRNVACAVLAVALTLLAVACGGSPRKAAVTTTPAAPATAFFAYDRTQPVALIDRGRVNPAYPIAVRDVSYASGDTRVPGYLIQPPGKGRLPAVVYLHGAGGDRRQFLLPGSWLVARGAIVLTITAPSTTEVAKSSSPRAALDAQREVARRDVMAVRRAIDLLASLPRVDRSRIGLVGWSGGARTAAIVAGIDRRVKTTVLMSGGALPVSDYAATAPGALKKPILQALGQVDPLRYVGRARAGSLLLQNGTKDKVVPRAALESMARAAHVGVGVHWYPAGHELSVSAYRDQLAWLTRKLAIDGPAVHGVRTGP